MVASKLTLLCLALMAVQAAAQIRGCYYQNDAKWRPAPIKFDSNKNYVWGLCSHVFYSFAQISGTTLTGDNAGYKTALTFKDHNPSLKVMLSVGGDGAKWSFEQLVANPKNIETWAKNAVAHAKQNKFDGIDIDWEFPNGFKNQFTTMMKALRSAAPKGFLISAAMTADIKDTAPNSYDLRALNATLDFFNIMTYDYHGVWNGVTGHNSGMGTSTKEQYTIQWTIQYYLDKGLDAKKLVLGVPTYSRGFTLNNNNGNQGPNSPAKLAATPGQYLKDKNGIYLQQELCKVGGTVKFDSAQKATYKQNGNQWFSFEDKNSINEKVKYIKAKKLAGAFIWSLEADDFGNVCGKGRYPVMNAINKALMGRTWN